MLPVSGDVGLLFVMFLLTPVRAQSDDGSPHNVVGYFTEGVILQCNRDAPGEVRWSHIAPGTTRERLVPGRHSYWGSNYGRHGLRLENLRRSDAGLYVCRSADVPQSFKPASAFLVVVADKPVCRDRPTADSDDHLAAVSCRIVYNGMLNLTLSITRVEDNATVVSRNYTSLVGGSWWLLETRVPVSSAAGRPPPPTRYACAAEFYSNRTHPDVAKNRPSSIEVPCEGERPEHAVETHVSETTTTVTPDVFSQSTAGSIHHTVDNSQSSKDEMETPVDDDSSTTTALVISAVALFVSLVLVSVVIFWLVRRRVRRQTRVRVNGDERPSTSAERVDKRTSTLLDGDATGVNRSAQDLSVQYHANATNGPTVSLATPTRGGRSYMPNVSGVSVSSSATSLPTLRSCVSNPSLSLDEGRHPAENRDDDDDDESNEKTLVPSDRRQLAQALLNNRQ